MVTNRDLITTASAKFYMKYIPKKVRKYTNPIVKQGIKLEKEVQKGPDKTRAMIKTLVQSKTKRLLGFSDAIIGKKGKR